jgi:hypothetical protein
VSQFAWTRIGPDFDFEFQMQQKSDDVRRYGIACSKAAVLKAFLILPR